MPTPHPKIVLYGSYAQGKSALLVRFIRNVYGPTQSTIGASFSSTSIEYEINGQKKILYGDFWDTAGQERYASLAPLYIKGSSAIILCIRYDEFNPTLLEQQLKFIRLVLPATPTSSPSSPMNIAAGRIYLCITMIDLEKERKTSIVEDLEKWIVAHPNFNIIRFYKTSSLSDKGVQEMFREIIYEANLHFNSGMKEGSSRSFESDDRINLSNSVNESKNSGCCSS